MLFACPNIKYIKFPFLYTYYSYIYFYKFIYILQIITRVVKQFGQSSSIKVNLLQILLYVVQFVM